MHEEAHPPAAQPGFDTSEPRARFIVLMSGALVGLLVAIVLGLQWYFDHVREQQIFVKQLEPVSAELKAVRARDEEALHQYRYLDRAKGTVRLPIERAMELVLKEQGHAAR